jgi:carbonic anhydrase/acetyltransferase-like protein (isoleucine patch superfamily)
LADEGNERQLALERSLVRMQAALARATAAGALAVPGKSRAPTAGPLGGVLLALSAGCFLVLAGTGLGVFLPLALGLGLAGGGILGLRRPKPLQPGAPAHIGMGASVSSSAVVEPGAIVQMGATVRKGATVRSGAVVGMGSTVGVNAVIENDAMVGWGATVRAGAVLGAKAIVGWGATVGKGVQVPPGMRLRMGATVTAGWLREMLPGIPTLAPGLSPGRDAAEVRVAAACDRLASELRAAPEQVRSFLGASDATVAGLRRACEDLFRREQAVRAELDPAALARLEQDKRGLEERLGLETDERIRQSCLGAVAAIDEQRRQRELLRVSADRLQAERMRLVYTLEGLAAQFVRLRTAGAEAGRLSSDGLEQGVKQLGAELDAIAEALDEESHGATPTRVRG